MSAYARWKIGAVILALAAGIGLLSWLGKGLDIPLGQALGRLGALCPWPAAAPWAAFLLFFLGLHVALAPYQLNHARVDRGQAKVSPSFVNPRRNPKACRFFLRVMPGARTRTVVVTDRAAARTLMVSVLDVLVLFLVARAATEPSARLAENAHLLLWPDLGVWWRVGFVAAFFAADWLLGMGAVHAAKAAFERSRKLVVAYTGSGFLGRRAPESTLFTQLLPSRIVVYFVPLLLLAALHGDNPFLPALLVSFGVAKNAVLGVCEYVSWWLDWSSDRWVEGLASELAGGDAPRQRLAAAKKLRRLGRWAGPAQAALDSASDACFGDILRAVAARFAETEKAIRANPGRDGLEDVRGVFLYLARELTGARFTAIGAFLGRRRYQKIAFEYSRVRDAVRENKELAAHVLSIRDALGARDRQGAVSS